MLKIKDNIDLKELERYGFKKQEYINDFNVDEWDKVIHLDENNNILDEIPPLDRNEINWVTYIKKSGEYDKFWTVVNVLDNSDEPEYLPRQILEDDVDIDTIYDLIKADLVEKVEENEENN